MPQFNTDIVEGVVREVLAYDYMSNGMFVCSSPFTKSILRKKKEWDFNYQFRYDKYLSNSGTGGGIQEDVFNKDLSMVLPSDPVTAHYVKTFGSILDGMMFSMEDYLVTKNVPRAALITAFGLQMHSFKQNFAGMFTNAVFGGNMGCLFRIGAEIKQVDGSPVVGFTPTVGTPFKIVIPSNVANYGIKGKGFCIRSTGRYGAASVAEIYSISIQKQVATITALPGSTPGPWAAGDWIQRAGTRKRAPGSTYGMDAAGNWTGSGQYTADAAVPNSPANVAGAGFMQGLPELFPSDFDTAGNRLHIGRYYDGDPDRLEYTIDRAGDAIIQRPNESIADAVYGLYRNAIQAAPGAPWLIVMHPDVDMAMALQEHETKTFRSNPANDAFAKRMLQRGINVQSYTIAGKTFDNVVLDFGCPTDKVFCTVDNIVEYNCFNQVYSQIDEYIKETFGDMPEKITGDELPLELIETKLDWSRRVAVGAPQTGTMRQVQQQYHPSTIVPIDFEELGALFCERPHLFSTLQLADSGGNPLQVINPADYA